jgi:hypothetical protein
MTITPQQLEAQYFQVLNAAVYPEEVQPPLPGTSVRVRQWFGVLATLRSGEIYPVVAVTPSGVWIYAPGAGNTAHQDLMFVPRALAEDLELPTTNQQEASA